MSPEEHTWIAFLRAINLGAHHKFPKDAIRSAVEAAGGNRVETYINTGNVRLDHALGERPEVETLLESTFAADRGFEVPTICFTPAELAVVAADAEAIGAGHDGVHYVWLLKSAPATTARDTVNELTEGRVRVVGRAAHLIAPDGFMASRKDNAAIDRHLGVGTSRNVTVIRTLAERWD